MSTVKPSTANLHLRSMEQQRAFQFDRHRDTGIPSASLDRLHHAPAAQAQQATSSASLSLGDQSQGPAANTQTLIGELQQLAAKLKVVSQELSRATIPGSASLAVQAAASGGNASTAQAAASGGEASAAQTAASGSNASAAQAAANGGNTSTAQAAANGGDPSAAQAATSGGDASAAQTAASSDTASASQAAVSSDSTPGAQGAAGTAASLTAEAAGAAGTGRVGSANQTADGYTVDDCVRDMDKLQHNEKIEMGPIKSPEQLRVIAQGIIKGVNENFPGIQGTKMAHELIASAWKESKFDVTAPNGSVFGCAPNRVDDYNKAHGTHITQDQLSSGDPAFAISVSLWAMANPWPGLKEIPGIPVPSDPAAKALYFWNYNDAQVGNGKTELGDYMEKTREFIQVMNQ